jgi:integrase
MASISKLPSGKWRALVRTKGISRSGTFYTKKEASLWADSVERQTIHVATLGYSQPPKEATVKDLIDKYIKLSQQRFGKTKTSTLNRLISKIGHVQLRSLSALVLRDYVDNRIEEGAGGVTIASDLSHLSAVLNWGRHSRRLDIPNNLAVDVRRSLKHMGLNTRSVERSREPTQSELEALYEYWSANPRQAIDMVKIVKFALLTGMRLGEIARIRIEDLNYEQKAVLIRDRKDPRHKYGNNQLVPLFEEAWDIAELSALGRKSGYIFGVRAASVSSAFTRACKKLGIEDLRFHDLRHKATADFFRNGLEIPYVAVMTGHKTWAMLKRYTKITAADVHDALARLKSA